METNSDFFGTTLNLTAAMALERLESAISEGLLTAAAGKDEPNLYGRPVSRHSSANLSFLSGMAAAGLRTAALLDGDDWSASGHYLRRLIRQHLPAVVYLTLPTAAGADIAPGAFQLVAGNPQEALDLALIAHRASELSLIPGVLILEADPSFSSSQPVAVPDREILRQFPGDPDDLIDCPTPAQRMIFGKRRRRVPHWFNFDFPALSGAAKDHRALALEAAARQQYFYHHLPELIDQAMAEYAALTGRSYGPTGTFQAEKADYLILTRGAACPQAVAAAQYLQSREKTRVGCLNLHLLRPFPAGRLAALLADKKGVTVLDHVAGGTPEGSLFQEVKSTLSGLGKKLPALYAGSYAPPLAPDDLIGVFRNMMRGGAGKATFVLGVDFTRRSSSVPAHEVLLQTIAREYPLLAGQSLNGGQPPAQEPAGTAGADPGTGSLPALIRRYQDHGPPYTRLSRFFQDTAGFYRSGSLHELVADPFQSVEAVPPATARLAAAPPERALPVFRPENCTGCGQCMIYCPHTALPSLAIGVEGLLRGAMAAAAARGRPATQFTPLVKNLARLAGPVIRNTAGSIARAGDFLPPAFEKLAGQLNYPEEKMASLRQEWAVLLEIIDAFPVAVTDAFFTNPEQRERGSGELFSLAVDPQSCTGCGICAAVCPADALVMAPPSPDRSAELENHFQLWEQLPDTPAETITRLVHDPEYDSFAAVLLSRYYYQSLTGASPTEDGAPAKAMLHLVTAVAESVAQPRVVKFSREIDELIAALSSNIHDILSNALPRDNFLPLWEAASEAGGDRLPLDALIGRLSAHEHLKLVDTTVLQRKIELVSDLKDLRHALTTGPTGAGRARYAMILTAGAWPWAERFPFQPFITPVQLIDPADDPAEWIRGMMQGQLRHSLDEFRLLRRARLEAKDQYRPEIHAPELAALDWSGLSDDEQQTVPPILLAGNRQLAEQHLGRLQPLLASSWPVKVFVLDDGAPNSAETDAGFPAADAALFAAVAGRRAFVLRGSLGAPGPLFDGLRQGLHRPRPALFHLLAPGPAQHSFSTNSASAPPWPALAPLALYSRAFTAFTSDPETTGGSLTSALTTAANPAADADWYRGPAPGALHQLAGAEENTLTYADWLATLASWQDQFRPYRPEDGAAQPLAAYLELDPAARTGKAPVITRRDPAGRQQNLTVSARVVEATQEALQRWQTLRELAGTRTAFPQPLRAAVERELTEKHEEELARLKAGYEEKLKNQEHELMERTRVRLREKLLALSHKNREPRTEN